jgi:phosphate/sulfate permease
MDLLFIFIVVCLLALAVFDLSVGVSNDAVNFLNSALGSRAASFRTILIIAAVGVFIGAVMSNGMMDIARHGIFNPQHFSFFEVMCIFLAVMVADIILLDVFNTLGMPTSTTVSMVFALLGASFAVSMLKMHNHAMQLSDLINTEKALSVIIGIFLSVAIAFFFGTLVQFVSRTIFTFSFRRNLKWKIGIFGGLATTSIIYFLLLKGIKDMSFMTPELKSYIAANTSTIIVVCFVVSTILMQILHACKVNVLKVIVLLGTFSLAMAFAGNDLVNFIGVPLSGLSSWQDYAAHGAGNPNRFMMQSLQTSANTPFVYLLVAGVIMVVALATSKKAQNVSRTEIGLGNQGFGDEMFGSSRIARRLVRMSLSALSVVHRYVPRRVLQWIDSRFDTSRADIADGAAFDLLRASVNLMLAGMLIAIGTSLKLPLSTTFVTFMVAMGTSLADRAWGRESAVFRITGVVSVIGGWFITAGAAFIGAGLVAVVMYYGGAVVIIACALIAIFILLRSNYKFRKRQAATNHDDLFNAIISSKSTAEARALLVQYMAQHQQTFVAYAADTYTQICNGFLNDDVRPLARVQRSVTKTKDWLKNERRKQTLCLRYIDHDVAIEKSTWFHTANNACMSINYNLRRINEVCKEHVDNNFHPLPLYFVDDLHALLTSLEKLFDDTAAIIADGNADDATIARRNCNAAKDNIALYVKKVYTRLRSDNPAQLRVLYVYLNILQETNDLISTLRRLIRATTLLR